VKRIGLIKTAALSAAVVLITGCATKPQTLYNYGSYSESYYAYKQDASAEKLLAMQQAIENAIENAGDSISGRVPPGMYANLGYIYLKQGKTGEALHYFEMEKSTYPESAHFMDRVIEKVNKAEAKGDAS